MIEPSALGRRRMIWSWRPISPVPIKTKPNEVGSF